VDFIHHQIMGIDCFVDGPDGSPGDAVRFLYAGEKLKPEYVTPSADVTETEAAEGYDVLSLKALVRMKLNSFRRKDQVHMLDMLEVGLIDSTWLASLPAQHAERLQQLIDDPDG